MRGLAIVTIIASVVVTIYLVAVAVYLRNIKGIVTSTTTLNILFWTSIVLIAVFVGLVVYAAYDMVESGKVNNQVPVKTQTGNEINMDPNTGMRTTSGVSSYPKLTTTTPVNSTGEL